MMQRVCVCHCKSSGITLSKLALPKKRRAKRLVCTTAFTNSSTTVPSSTTSLAQQWRLFCTRTFAARALGACALVSLCVLRHECVWFGIGTFALIRFVLLLAALNLKKVKYTYKAINLLKGEQVCVCVC